MKAHIITIGTEILIGQIVDTNSAWLGHKLTQMGLVVDQVISIPDQKEAIEETVTLSLNKANVIIITGGLGPTNDDITKKTLAGYFQSPLVFSESVMSDVMSFLDKRGGRMNQLNEQQALIPEKAVILPNKQGTAPGMLFETNQTIIISLPGVPSEMKGIMEQYGFKAISDRLKLPANYYHTTLITGIAEAHLAERLTQFEQELPSGVEIAYLPSPGIIKLRLGLKGAEMSQITNVVNQQVIKLHQLIPEFIFGENEDTLPQIIGRLLFDQKATISTAESCTGGFIAHQITTIPGCSQWFKGSIIAYDNQVKINSLDVSPANIEAFGAVSEQVVKQMALGVQMKLKTDYALATSGIAGPDGGSPEKPVGTVWIAVASPKMVYTRMLKFGNERDNNIKRATIAILNMLREIIIKKSI